MKKVCVLAVALMMMAGSAYALKGEVVDVQGKKVTIKMDKKDAKKLQKGATVDVEVKDAPAAAAGGGDMLMGC